MSFLSFFHSIFQMKRCFLFVCLLILKLLDLTKATGCFNTEQTWVADSEGFSNISSAVRFLDCAFNAKQHLFLPQETCQSICAESSGCKGFTFFDGQASPHDNYCEIFQDVQTASSCSNCISGPSSCFCSGNIRYLQSKKK